MRYFKLYYPNKLVCPCELVVQNNKTIRKCIGVVLPWNNDTAYDNSIIERYKSEEGVSFIFFKESNPRYYGYKIMMLNNDDRYREMLKDIEETIDSLKHYNIYSALVDINDLPTLNIMSANNNLICNATYSVNVYLVKAGLRTQIKLNDPDMLKYRTLRDLKLKFTINKKEFK